MTIIPLLLPQLGFVKDKVAAGTGFSITVIIATSGGQEPVPGTVYV